MSPSALIALEDRTDGRQAIERAVERAGFRALPAGTLREAREILQESTPDVLLIDVDLPDGKGLDLLDELEDRQDADIIIVSGARTVDEAVHAMRENALEVLGKPVDADKLAKLLKGARRTARLRRQVGKLRGELHTLGRFGELVGKSPAMERVYDLVTRVAPTSATVLITGETGTGKEVVARTLHEIGPRSEKAFVPVNCGALPEGLIESELFGHERGSFTGATRTRKGVFEEADGGTLFLDEITEMSPELQVRLLRVLETQEIARVGGDRAMEVDVRIVAATNRSPAEAVREEKLREDLLFRLNVFQIVVPPLRRRDSDSELLARHFLEEIVRREGVVKELTERSIRKIRNHDWPGNVRELRNAIERAYIVAGDRIRPQDISLEPAVEAEEGTTDDLEISAGMTIAEAERRLILATLEEVSGHRERAAEMLGISVKTLYNRLSEYREAAADESVPDEAPSS